MSFDMKFFFEAHRLKLGDKVGGDSCKHARELRSIQIEVVSFTRYIFLWKRYSTHFAS